MAARFVTLDYDTPLLLPPNLREWVPAGHLAHFIWDAVEEMDLRQVRVKERGTGSEEYPPRMLLARLLYGYASGVFSSRRIEQAPLDRVPVRMICGDTHPDHDPICPFRRENQARLAETFVRGLELAQALKFLQVGQITVAVDGTQVLANASQHAAVSDEHAGNGQPFEPSYHAPAAVEVDRRLMVGERVSPAPNNKQELVPSVAAISPPVESVAALLTDSGFYSEAAVHWAVV